MTLGSHLGVVWVPSTASASNSKHPEFGFGNNQLAMGALLGRLQISSGQNCVRLSADIWPPRNYACDNQPV
jgi:hypothetical protein